MVSKDIGSYSGYQNVLRFPAVNFFSLDTGLSIGLSKRMVAVHSGFSIGYGLIQDLCFVLLVQSKCIRPGEKIEGGTIITS